MWKLSNQSKDISQENIKKVEELFPNCVTETYDKDGNLVRSIDFDILRQDLSSHVVEGPKERYQFNWPGKRGAILLANAPTTNTLRPLPEKSVDFENTKNVYIEGDNLEALKILRETYMGKIKMIYIDPPYNTGNDFVYKDDFKQSTEEYLKSSGGIDEGGNRMEVNGESNGRFHSDWLNMMYPRLILARDLLTDDGVIFISIDDNEVTDLATICNDIFGNLNLVAQIPWQSRASMQNDTDFSINHEYILVYAKKRRQTDRHLKESNATIWKQHDSFVCRPLPLEITNYSNPDNDPRGPWKADPMDAPNIRQNLTYIITNPLTGEQFLPPKGRHWRTEETNYKQWLAENRIVFGKDGKGRPQLKVFYNEKKDFGSVDNSWFSSDKVGTTTQGTKEIQQLFGGEAVFDKPKPTSLLKKLIKLANLDDDDIILDFFSGSATTADALLQLNFDNKTKNKFVLIQLPENSINNVFAQSQGHETICDIGEERIRRAGKKIKESNPLISQDLDVGFRVFRIDSSNMKDILSTPNETQLSLLEDADSSIKPDRNSLDLVTQVMLQLGITLDADIKIGKCAGGGEYYAVNGNDLICCFDKSVSESDIEEMARMQPLNVAFRDDSFASDQDEVNCEQIFKTLSPITGKNIFVL